MKMEVPTDTAAVARLPGTVTYLAKPWSWGETQDKSFRKLKKLLTESFILANYDHKSEVIIQCDASQFGIGAALMQNGKPLAYASRTLTDTVSIRNY